MNKEEILELSKKSNKDKDPYTMEVKTKASSMAATAMILVGCFFTLFDPSDNPVVFMMISIYLAIYSMYYSSKINDEWKWTLRIFACITTIAFIITLLLHLRIIVLF